MAPAQALWPDAIDVDLNFSASAPAPGWDLRLGLGVESEPTFQGSDKNETEVSPFLLGAYRADWGNLFLHGDGLGYSRVFNDRFGLLLRLEAEDARAEEDDERLIGLGDQEEELELEIAGRYFFGPWSVGASIAPATGDKGVVWFVGGSYTWRSDSERLFVGLNADLSGSTRDNQQTDFGITAQQAASGTFGYPVYDAGGGLKSFGVDTYFDYRLSDRWFLRGQLEYERLLGDVADSPLVQMGGSENQFEVGLSLYFQF